MKKFVYILIALAVLGLLISGCGSVVPDEDLSRMVKSVFVQMSDINPNINATLMLNDKNGSMMIKANGALPEHGYEISARWYVGSDLHGLDWPLTSTNRGTLQFREYIRENAPTFWSADSVTIMILEEDTNVLQAVITR